MTRFMQKFIRRLIGIITTVKFVITSCSICLVILKSDLHFLHNFVICLPFPLPRIPGIMM